MNMELLTFIVVLAMLMTACVPLQATAPDAIATVAMTQSGAVVTTGQGGGPAVGLPPSTINNGFVSNKMEFFPRIEILKPSPNRPEFELI